jgi:hypothetical protein
MQQTVSRLKVAAMREEMGIGVSCRKLVYTLDELRKVGVTRVANLRTALTGPAVVRRALTFTWISCG